MVTLRFQLIGSSEPQVIKRGKRIVKMHDKNHTDKMIFKWEHEKVIKINENILQRI